MPSLGMSFRAVFAAQYRQFRGTSHISLRNKSIFLHPKGEDIAYGEKFVRCRQSNHRRLHGDIKILLKVILFGLSGLFLRDEISKIIFDVCETV